MNLIASNRVIFALRALCEEAADSNKQQFCIERYNRLFSDLLWEIRTDLKISPTKRKGEFSARLWSSDVGSNLPMFSEWADEEDRKAFANL